MVENCFLLIDQAESSVLTSDDVAGKFSVLGFKRCFPEFNEISSDNIVDKFLSSMFLNAVEGTITIDDFIYYHSSISAELENATKFEDFMRYVWNF